MDKISEQNSLSESNLSPLQSERDARLNKLFKKQIKQNDQQCDPENNFGIMRDLKTNNWKNKENEKVSINCKFNNDNDDIDSDDDEYLLDNINQQKRLFPKQTDVNSKINDKYKDDLQSKPISMQQQTKVEDQKLIKSDVNSQNNYNQIRKRILESYSDLSSDEDDGIAQINKNKQQQQHQPNQNLDQQKLNKFDIKDISKKTNIQSYQNTKNNIDDQIQNRQLNLGKSNTTFDKSISDIELNDSVQDPKKDTFYRLREDLMKQLDSEREKNRMIEQKLISRDKSFIEIKSQFNELLFNYESKNKECQMLRKNNYLNNNNNNFNSNSGLNDQSSSKSSIKHQGLFQGSNQTELNTIEKKFNKLHNKYAGVSDSDSSDQEMDFQKQNNKSNKNGSENISKHRNSTTQDSQIDSNTSRRFRNNSNTDSDLISQRKQIDLDHQQQKNENIQSQQEISRLKIQLDQSKQDLIKSQKKIEELESEVQKKQQKIDFQKNQIEESRFQQEKYSKSLNQLEESIEQQRKQQIEINTIKQNLKEKEEMLRRFKSEENDNQDLLEKAEKLLKQFEALKEENQIQSEIIEKLQQQNKELSDLTKPGSENHQLRDFAEQQDVLIQKLSSELENQKQNYQIQKDYATRNILDIIHRIFGQKGQFLIEPVSSTIWVNQFFGKESNDPNKNDKNDQSLFQEDSERASTKQQINYSQILKEIDQHTRDYDRYKDFAKVFKEMIKSVAKNELNQSPTLRDCWKYFKWLYQHYIQLKLNDQMNQSTSNILLKMLKLQNEHEIIVAIQNLITQNDRLKHIQSIMTQTPHSISTHESQQYPLSTDQDINYNGIRQQQQQNSFVLRGDGKENKPENKQNLSINTKRQDTSNRSQSPMINKNITTQKNKGRQDNQNINQSYSNSIQNTTRSSNIPPNYYNTQQSMESQINIQQQYPYIPLTDKHHLGQIEIQNNRNYHQNFTKNNNKIQNNRSMPRLVQNNFN